MARTTLARQAAWWLRRIIREEAILLLVGLTVVLATWGFVEVAQEVLQGSTRAADEALLRSLRRPDDPRQPIGPSWLFEVARDVTALGSPAIILLALLAVVGYLAFQGQWSKLLLVVLASGTGAALSTGLKELFARPRPGFLPQLVPATSPSFPSGHSMLTAVVYLTLGALLARFAPRRRVKAFVLAMAMLLTFLVGLTRVYLGVHYPTDVLGGWVAGLAWALICWMVARYLQRRGALRAEAGTREVGRWRRRAGELKREVFVLYFAVRDPRVPWYAKALAGCVVAYALSPIDLIPDPIPILGYLDDLVLVPLGVLAVRRMIPAPILADCRRRADSLAARPKSWVGAAVIVLIWLAVTVAAGYWLLRT